MRQILNDGGSCLYSRQNKIRKLKLDNIELFSHKRIKLLFVVTNIFKEIYNEFFKISKLAAVAN